MRKFSLIFMMLLVAVISIGCAIPAQKSGAESDAVNGAGTGTGGTETDKSSTGDATTGAGTGEGGTGQN